MRNLRRALTAALLMMSITLAACGDTSPIAGGRSARTDTVIICTSQEPPSLYRIASASPETVQTLIPADPQGWRPDRAYGYETLMLEGGEFPTLETVARSSRRGRERRSDRHLPLPAGYQLVGWRAVYRRRHPLHPACDPRRAVGRGVAWAAPISRPSRRWTTTPESPMPGVVDPLYYLPPL
jgi:hypothetical protein